MRKSENLELDHGIDGPRNEVDFTILGDDPASLRIAFFAIVIGAMIWIGFITVLVLLLF